MDFVKDINLSTAFIHSKLPDIACQEARHACEEMQIITSLNAHQGPFLPLYSCVNRKCWETQCNEGSHGEFQPSSFVVSCPAAFLCLLCVSLRTQACLRKARVVISHSSLTCPRLPAWDMTTKLIHEQQWQQRGTVRHGNEALFHLCEIVSCSVRLWDERRLLELRTVSPRLGKKSCDSSVSFASVCSWSSQLHGLGKLSSVIFYRLCRYYSSEAGWQHSGVTGLFYSSPKQADSLHFM